MDTAIVFTYGRPTAGREKLAFEAFQDSMTFWEKKAIDGLCSHPVSYTFVDGGGMMIIFADRPRLMDLLELEEFQHIFLKAGFAVPDLAYRLAAVGDESVNRMGMWAGVGAELGLF
ncbi:MAG TPA: hypothetical protein VLD62_02260 [Acidimicrobiia bacterium]|nr:hypothetical protein [Acidimicrobiia bacterium]